MLCSELLIYLCRLVTATLHGSDIVKKKDARRTRKFNISITYMSIFGDQKSKRAYIFSIIIYCLLLIVKDV